LVRSRAEAKRVIEEGLVLVRGLPAERPTTMVASSDPIRLAGPVSAFVSRGGDKLDGALADLHVPVERRRWLDLGASTGGFTDRLLQGGAASVIALDVGYGQLDWRLRNDPRVHVIERTNARLLAPGDLPFVPDAVTADLSFISLTVVLPVVVGLAADDADHLLLVKPQFEVGRASVGKGGVVRDPELWRAAVQRVADAAAGLGLGVAGATASRLPGPAGNREFFLHLHRGAESPPDAIERAIAGAA
ncbi:MAG TPA: TlyA family RNA methyltransferase, partial [Actinomycetota bacterium]|nr:TlyA family RNA methyltransferase [Actinomycetota bacterium]